MDITGSPNFWPVVIGLILYLVATVGLVLTSLRPAAPTNNWTLQAVAVGFSASVLMMASAFMAASAFLGLSFLSDYGVTAAVPIVTVIFIGIIAMFIMCCAAQVFAAVKHGMRLQRVKAVSN